MYFIGQWHGKIKYEEGSCYGKVAPCSRNKYVTRDFVSEASCDEDVREDAANLLANLFSVYASLFLSRVVVIRMDKLYRYLP